MRRGWPALAVMVGACSASSDPALDPLRVGYTRNLTMAPLLIAEAEGYFEQQGIDVELVAMESAAVALPSLLRGSLDVLPGPVSSAVFNAIHRGGRVKLVADKGAYDSASCYHQALVVSRAAAEAGDPPVLKRVSTAKEHFNQFFVERALEANGYDPADVELYHVPQAAEYEAVATGRLDGAFMGEPWLSRVKSSGAVVKTPTNSIFDQHQYSVVLFGTNLLDRRTDLGERFTVALLQGLRAYNQGKTDRNLDVLSELIGYERSELEDFCWPTMGTDGQIHIESIVDFQRWAVARGDQDAMVDPADFWEPRFIQNANAVLDTLR